METKPLLYGIVGFMLGGLLVSVAAVTFEKPRADSMQNGMTMGSMVGSIEGKAGDEFDRAFIAGMIEHHQGAIDMAKLSAANAKHEEIKTLSVSIIGAQEKEIAEMKQWQKDWGYEASESGTHSSH